MFGQLDFGILRVSLAMTLVAGVTRWTHSSDWMWGREMGELLVRFRKSDLDLIGKWAMW